MNDFVSIQDGRFMAGGRPVLLRGLGVGSWLNLEHFMMGVPGWDGEMRLCLEKHIEGFTDRFTKAFFAEEDAVYLRSLGISFIRVPVNHHLFWDDERDTFREFGFTQLKRLADICEKNGLYFLPDLHTTPGGQNPDWHSESSTGTAQFWAFAALRKNAVKIWQRIAHMLKNSPALLGYDLLNEPVLPKGRADLLNGFYRDTIAAIRAEDTQHIVFLEGDRFSMDFSKIDMPSDDHWAFTYHFYPGVWDEKLLHPAMDEGDRRQAFQEALEEIILSMGGYRGPLLCGEMGYELSCLNPDYGVELTSITIEALESRRSSWCLWCYKDARFMGLAYPNDNSGWMRLCGDVKRQWDHHRASRLGLQATDAVEKLCPYPLTEEEKYSMQFIIRAMVAHADLRHILSPALKALPQEILKQLPNDFRFSNCERNIGLETLLKSACGVET